ncbi:MAG: DUF2247 family protein [Flavobacteriales bacterium]|nr:DUF2247 family protein [Flavobacteriales bacterium]MCB9363995.1 DUF2247 family protein [Flavobacteriales bacterium]
MKIIELLLKNGVKMTWTLAYIGISKDFISFEDCLKEADLIKELDTDVLSELFIKIEESKDSALNFLKESGLVNDNEIEKSNWVWSTTFLYNIIQTEEDIHDKLRAIENIWSLFDYPEELKPYIYYMPNSLGTKTEKELYERFLLFMKEENKKF